MFESSAAAKVTKPNRETSKVTPQEENDIKDVIATPSSKLELGFHPKTIQKIHRLRQLQEIVQRLR